MNRHLEVLYCDDVRFEVGNKLTYVGVYSADLFLNAPTPAVLPKLCVVVRIDTPTDAPIQSLAVHVEYDGNVVIDSGELIVQEKLKAPDAPPMGLDDPDWRYTRHSWGTVFQLSPFVISSVPSLLKVLATADGEVLKGRVLRVLFPHAVQATTRPTATVDPQG